MFVLELHHSYAAISLDCWGSSQDAPFIALLSLTLRVYVTSLLSLFCVSLSQQVFLAWCYDAYCPPLFCPLNPRPVEADGRPS